MPRTLSDLRAWRASRSWAPGSITSVVLALLSLLVYGLTLSPAVNTLDGGELAASAATLGVAHPTGYPLFLLVSRAFIILVPVGTVIWKLNLLMALFGAASVLLVHRLFFFLLQRPGVQHPGASIRIAAASATLILAFTRTYWIQSVAYEVYSFQAMLTALVLLLFMSALRKTGAVAERIWALFALALGLSFTNHMTTVILLPAMLYYHFVTQGLRATVVRAAKALPLVLLGITVYLYLPIRASVNPFMNWGNPSSLENFMWHVQGKQFWQHMFYSSDLALWKFRLFVSQFPIEFGYFPPLLALPGLVFLARRDRKLLVFSLLLAGACVFYSINYGITDIESYFVLSYVMVALWIAFGIRTLVDYVHRQIRSKRIGQRVGQVAGTVLVLPFLFPLTTNYAAADFRGMYAAQDYVVNVLESAEPGGVIFTDTDGRHTIAFYLQIVEGVRPDVAFLDKGWMEYPYYVAQLKNRFPWLRESLHLTTDIPAEFNRPYSQAVVAEALHSLLAENSTTRPFYFTYNFPPDFFTGFRTIPSGLGFRMFRDTNGKTPAPEAGPIKPFVFRPFPRVNDDTREIENYYALGYLNQGSYRLWLGNLNGGIFFLEQALSLRPYFPQAQNLLDQARAEQAARR